MVNIATATPDIRAALRPKTSQPHQTQKRFQRAVGAQHLDHPALQPEGSPMDLMLRGFSQADIVGRTGVDVGYHGSSLRASSKGVDRFEYKVEHVRVRLDQAAVLVALVAHAEGASKIATLQLLGLSGYNNVTLRRLFAALGLAEEFATADKAFRRGNMIAGMVASHGVANPFELAEFQKAG